MADPDNRDLAPEAVNPEQEDADTQAQDIADEALGRRSTGLGLGNTEKVPTGDDTDDVQDLVDHMQQMDSSGVIDMSAYRGERNDDGEDGMLGEAAED